MGKEEIARNEQFLLFPQCFLLTQKIVSPFVKIFDIKSLFAAELEEPNIGISGKGLNDGLYLQTRAPHSFQRSTVAAFYLKCTGMASGHL